MSTVYTIGADLPDLVIQTLDGTGTPIDYSSGYTFSAKVGRRGEAAQFTKSSGVTGAAGSVTIAWATTAELNTLAAGLWTVQVTATRNSDSKNRYVFAEIEVKSPVT